MNRHRRVPLLVFSLLVAIAAPRIARAQAQGAAVDIFRAASAGSDWFSLDSMDYRGKLRFAASATLDYAHGPLVVYNPDGSRLTSPIRHQGFLDIGASIMIFERLRISATLPVAFYQSGTDVTVDGVDVHPGAKGGLGDLNLGADVRLWGTYGHPFSISIGGAVSVPTGSEKNDFGHGNVTGDAHFAIAGDISLFTYAAQAGFAFRRDEQIANVRFNDEFRFAAAVGVRLVKKRLLIGPEFFGLTDVGSSAGKARKTSLEGDLGIHYKFDMGLLVGAGVGTGIIKEPGVPDVRALATVGWLMPYHEKVKVVVQPDRDGDGIYDVDDACPDVPGVRSFDRAKNGCPSPQDRDHDGILDEQDICPDVPQGDHPDPKRPGCPDKDTDLDGVYDSIDMCPDTAQGSHPDPPRLGCPDKDTDLDGVYDSVDMCPDVPQGMLVDPKRPGCPAPDRDGDRVPDDVDACPDQPGAPSPDPKKNGCPGLVVVKDSQITILQPVLFATDKDTILPTSYKVLTAVADSLRSLTQIKKISIEGHTDSKGKPAHNLDLSERRAQSVRKWLIQNGIAEERLDAHGYGQTRPIADNKTAKGRSVNRRVDFIIVPAPPVPTPP